MNVLVNILKGTLEEGLMYAVLALGVYITFSILDFPDLSVEGTLPFGAVLTGVLIIKGLNPWLCCLLAFIGGAVAGSVTGLLHVKLKIRPILSGILVMTALISINLVVIMAGTGGMSLATFFDKGTIFKSIPASFIPITIGGFKLRHMIVGLAIVVVCKILLDWFLTTKSGLLLRAAGNNSQYVVMLARDPGTSKILGLALCNGFAALAGSIIAQSRQSADLQMGIGTMVIGLAAVVIGMSLFRKVGFLKVTTKVILGAIIYQACLSLALEMGLPTNYQKLLMAVLFTLVLVGNQVLDKGRGKLHD
jgi:putative ABC transport system permease protein